MSLQDEQKRTWARGGHQGCKERTASPSGSADLVGAGGEVGCLEGGPRAAIGVGGEVTQERAVRWTGAQAVQGDAHARRGAALRRVEHLRQGAWAGRRRGAPSNTSKAL